MLQLQHMAHWTGTASLWEGNSSTKHQESVPRPSAIPLVNNCSLSEAYSIKTQEELEEVECWGCVMCAELTPSLSSLYSHLPTAGQKNANSSECKFF